MNELMHKLGMYLKAFAFVAIGVFILSMWAITPGANKLFFGLLIGWAIFGLMKFEGFFGWFRGKNGMALKDVHENARRLDALKQPFTLPPNTKPVTVGVFRVNKKKIIPVTLTPEKFEKNHVSIFGASGTGKTKLAAQITTQLSCAGHAIVVGDPKDDEFLPGQLNSLAKAAGKPFLYINLREPVAQWNPLAGCTGQQIQQLMEAALGLDPTGDPAVDFHRGEDRDACASMVETGFTNIPALAAAAGDLKACTTRTNFWRGMRELAALPAFQTAYNPQLEKCIEEGGIIYFVGDTDDLTIQAAQRLILARVLQIIKSRPRENARHVTLMADEFKYFLSNVALRALGTIRDRRCSLILCYQSYSDLADCGTLKPVAVLGAAKGNTTLKFVYKLEDGDTAAELVAVAGQERKMSERIDKQLKDGLEAGGFAETNVDLLTPDMLTTNMPKPMAGEASVCWVFGHGVPFPLSTMHLPKGEAPSVTKQPPVNGIAPSKATAKSDDLI